MVDIQVDFMIIEAVDSKVGVGTMMDIRGGGEDTRVEADMVVDLRIRIG